MKNAAIVTVCRMRLKDDGSPPDPGPPFAPRQREAPAPIIERKIENARPTVRRGQSEDDYDFDPFVSVSDQQAEEMRGILASLREDWLDYAKGCLPVYGVRVRFADEEGIVDVDLCFACDVLRVRRDGKPVWGEHIDTVRPGLVAFCKEVFPEDEEIQRLRPGR